MSVRYATLMAAFATTPWAVRPETLAIMQMVLGRWSQGVKLSDEDVQAAVGGAPAAAAARRDSTSRGPGSVAVIPIYGIISHRAHMVDDISGPGGTSTEKTSRLIRAAIADETIGAIVLDVDSPGGSVFGVKELADEIFQARSQKKIVAVANAVSASAAYWLATAAEELVVTPSGEVGSVGVYAAHDDVSGYMEANGVKRTLIHAGQYKVEGNAYEPLSDEARATVQQSVDAYHDMFLSGLAQNRGMGKDAVRKGFGEGRMFMAKDAINRGMADRVGTLDETIARLARSSQAQKPRSASAAAEARLRLASL